MVDIVQTLNQQFLAPLFATIFWLVLALVIMTVFWLISRLVKRIVVKIAQSFGVDSWVEEHKITSAIGNKKLSEILGGLAKWYFIVLGIAVVVASPEFIGSIFGMQLKPIAGLSEFLWGIVNYVPQALGGVLFFVLALLLARYLSNQILGLQHRLKNMAAFLVEGIIILFAAVIAIQMVLGPEIADTILELMRIFIQPFIIALAIVAGIVAGLAIGLGFKDELQKFAKEVRREYLG